MFSISIAHLADFNLTLLSCISMWGNPSNIHALNFQFFIYNENIEEKHWDSFVVLSFGIPGEPPCYVRQCSASGNSLYWIVKGTSGANMIPNMSYMSRGKFTAYACVYVGALQHTTACLQVPSSLQHLGGITKNNIMQ